MKTKNLYISFLLAVAFFLICTVTFANPSPKGEPPEIAPVLVTPFNNSANIEIFPELSWTEVSNAVTYKIKVSKLSDGVIVFETSTQDINYTITDGILEYDREYKWTVCACNEYGNSLWATAFVFKTLAINISGEDKNYKLNNNYPNPFNPVTKISFNIPKNTIVKIKIYDMLGREVKVLANNFYNAGMHSVEFNASNLSSGIYIYKMEAGDFKAIKKMMLVK